MATTPRSHRRTCLVVVLVNLFLHAGIVSCFSIGSGLRATRTSLHPELALRGAHSDGIQEAAYPNHLFARKTILPQQKRAPAIFLRLLTFVRSIQTSARRAIAIFAFSLFAVALNTRPAIARTKTNEAQATKVKEGSGSANSKCLKFIVTACAVAAGAATANKVRGLSHDDTSSDEQGVIDISGGEIVADGSDTQSDVSVKSPKPKPVHKIGAYPPKPNEPLVKDLDAKIERLREQERLALQHAAEKAEQAAKDEAAKQKRIVEEKIAKMAEEETNRIAAEKQRMEHAKMAEKERKAKMAKEDTNRISDEKKRMEYAKRAEEERNRLAEAQRERKEQIAKEEAKLNRPPVQEDRNANAGEYPNRKLVQSLDPAHHDLSRMLVENGSKKQTTSPEEARLLKERYGAMNLEDRAFNILVDLGMAEIHPDPSSHLDANEDSDDSANVLL